MNKPDPSWRMSGSESSRGEKKKEIDGIKNSETQKQRLIELAQQQRKERRRKAAENLAKAREALVAKQKKEKAKKKKKGEK